MAFSTTDSEMGTAVLTPDDLPDILRQKVVLKPEFSLSIYGGSVCGPSGGSQTPVAMPERTSLESTISDLLGGMKELKKKVTEQQDHITALSRLAVDQQNKISALETCVKEQSAPAQVVDCGTWKCQTALWDTAHKEEQIKFSKPFAAVPKVSVALNLTDSDKGWNTRLKVYATDIDTEGFTLHADVWNDTRMYGCGVSWLAIGAPLV